MPPPGAGKCASPCRNRARPRVVQTGRAIRAAPFFSKEPDMPPVQPVPKDMHTLTPHLICEGAAQALDFYVRAFGAVELARLDGPGGRIMHAQLRIGDSTIMLADDWPDGGCPGPRALKGSPVFLHLYVPDVDAAMARAAAAGATVTMPVTDMFWGDRYGQLTDPFGHRWSVATHQRDLTPDEIRAAAASSSCWEGAAERGRGT